ncbi:hypothetical protein D5086_024100 [Populus alba]|uniref:Uncharacterized protein n=3 Tax=Populus TaxID=3689 RepID=A0ACC4B629_POPAL|nr:uncharacterized protein LOC118060778 [Populus alba]KAJ6974309.1 hypothetical protein NC653_030416 [Populus alba x Populus x berolinensis]TKS04327.1 hypothetical protein D5086_0000145280 [Populus alba]
MGEGEIEEGKARDYTNNDDRNIDIDVALSYIDDRIQDILGQYQKDFEGGVSADTLGARFGGYGTFLPTFQRSPSIWSNPIAQQKVQSHGIQASSHDDQLAEGAMQNSTVSIRETVSARPEAASRSAFPLRVAKPLPEDRLVKPQSSREFISDYEPLKGPGNPSNQKVLKVRIKVGSDNCLPELKTSAIYSNLGLDMSPSSSSEDTDSPSECERDFPDSLEEHVYSPSCIVRIMTSSPIPSGAMLSPLHDCFLNLSEQGFLDHKRTVPVQECSAMQADEKVLVDKQKQPGDRSDRLELKNEHCNDPTNSFSACSKNESRMETSKGNHMLSDAGNQPPESKTTKVGKVAVGTGIIFRANLSGAKKELFSQKACKIHEVSAKATLTGKVQKDKKLGCDPRDNGSKGDKSLALFKDNYMPEELRKCEDRTLDLTKQEFEKKKASHLQDDMKVCHGGKQLSTGKKKPKGSKNDYSSTAGTSKNSMRIRLSAAPKEKIFQKSCKGDNALLEDLRKVKVKHTVSVSDRKARGNGSRSCLLRTSVEDEMKDNTLEVPEKEPLAFRNKSKMSSGDKKSSFVSTSKENLRGDINDVAPLAGPLPTEVPTFLIEEDWVCCDKCHKWRLLPYGTNPNQLPQKWLCSMLDWLPGMNLCTFSEEETTDALHALYRLPVAGNHGDQLSHSVSAESSITLVNTLHDLDQNPQDPSFSGGKKKLEMKEVSHPAQYNVNKKRLNSTMKNDQVFIERKSLHNRSLSSLETKLEKRLGDVQPQKFKSMREADQEDFKLPKKARMEGMQYVMEDHNTGGISKKEMGSNNKKYSSYRDVRYLSKDSTSLNVEKHQFQKTMVVEDPDPMVIEGKKRKSKDWMNGQIYPGNHSGNGQDNSISVEETSWSESRKERHSRKFKYEGKVSSASKGVCKLFGKEKINYLSQSTVDGKNSERRDLRDGLQCTEATSSSSLISSTCKVKINFPDVKGSPLESVCSSPLKISNRVSPRSFSGNHGCIDVGFCHFSGQTKCLEGESVGVSNWSETLRKEDSPVVAPIKEKSRDIYRHNDDKVEKKFTGQKVSSIKSLNNSTREDDQFGHEGYEASFRKMDGVFQKDCKSGARHNVLQNHSNSEFLDLLPSDTINQLEKSAGRHKSLDFLLFGNKKENQCWKSRESDALEVDGSSCDGLGRAPRQLGKDDGQNGIDDVMRRHPLLDASNILASNHLRNDFFSQVANDALEGAKDPKHSADPLQISASGLQIAELFFQAALKFLHGASLFNPNNNSTNNGNMTSAEMYGHAAKLCEYCASEFERCNDLASAFLAHKCIEVAYMRVVYSNDLTASRDRYELQTVLQRVSPVESPSSSNSDVENLNSEVKVEKRLITKDVGCSEATRDHVIPARNQPNFVRLLNFAEDVNLAMEALRKSQAAFAAAEIILAETGNMEGILSIKKVLDMGFHDVEGLLQLVRLAIESLRKTP